MGSTRHTHFAIFRIFILVSVLLVSVFPLFVEAFVMRLAFGYFAKKHFVRRLLFPFFLIFFLFFLFFSSKQKARARWQPLKRQVRAAS